VCLLSVVRAGSQAAPEQKEPMAGKTFSGHPGLAWHFVDEFMGTMGFFAASLGLNCVDCHTPDSLENWAKVSADDTPAEHCAPHGPDGARHQSGEFRRHAHGNLQLLPSRANRPRACPVWRSSTARRLRKIRIRFKSAGRVPRGPSADQILDRDIQALGARSNWPSSPASLAKGTLRRVRY